MRYVYFLLLLVIVTSCAQGRLRLKKVNKKDRIETVASHEQKERTSSSRKHKQEIVTAFEEEAIAAVSETLSASSATPAQSLEDTPTTDGIETSEINESEVEEDPTTEAKLRLAIIAEQDARKAKNAMIWSLAMLFAFFIPLAPLFSLIPFIVGSIKLAQSNRSNYITPEGERNARAARIMQIIYAALIILSIIFIVALIVLIL